MVEVEDSTAAASGLIRLAGMRSDREEMELHTATRHPYGNRRSAGMNAVSRGALPQREATRRLRLRRTGSDLESRWVEAE